MILLSDTPLSFLSRCLIYNKYYAAFDQKLTVAKSTKKIWIGVVATITVFLYINDKIYDISETMFSPKCLYKTW